MPKTNISLLNKFLVYSIVVFLQLINFINIRVLTFFIFVSVFSTSYLVYSYQIEDSTNNNQADIVSSPKVITAAESNIVLINPEVELKSPLIFSSPNQILAKSFLIYDLNSRTIVYEKNSNLTLPPASLTKMLSALFFIEDIEFDKDYLTYNECNFVEGQKLGFKKSEIVSGKDLMYSSLILSAGDSICNMYKISGKSITDFNNFAKSLGMDSSNFTNFIGLDFTNNYTSSRDVLKLTLRFIENDSLNSIVRLKSYQLRNNKVIYNTNKMLFDTPGSIGVKTGTTEGANQNLVYRFKDEERDLIIIILNSSDRYKDTKNILKYTN